MLSSRFNEALIWAADLHQHQNRKTSQTPYIAHLLSVAGLILESGGSEEQAIAALLHDSIEDQEVTFEEIARRFNPEVAELKVKQSLFFKDI
jgi:(p)ppGpp synthase/HD superfamily hydrolase